MNRKKKGEKLVAARLFQLIVNPPEKIHTSIYQVRIHERKLEGCAPVSTTRWTLTVTHFVPFDSHFNKILKKAISLLTSSAWAFVRT